MARALLCVGRPKGGCCAANFRTNCRRVFAQGKLRGFDTSINVILEDCEERFFDTEEGVEVIPLGLYIVRGDNL